MTAAEGRRYFEAAAEALAMLPDVVEADASASLLLRHYGQQGTLAALSSEV